MATFDPKEVFVVLGFNKLREVVGDLDQNFLAFVIGDATVGDGEGGLYHWVEDRSTADDGAATIVPPTQLPVRRGCWRRMFAYGATSSGIVVNSVAELRSIEGDLTSRKSATLGGYYDAGDGGGGTFVWDDDTVTSDNGGTVIVPTTSPRTGCWLRVFQAPWDVRWFGATGDGVTDDAAAIQAAIDATAGAGSYSGKRVYITSGTYYCGTTIVVDKSVCLYGDHGVGPNASSKLTFAPNVCGIHIAREVGDGGSWCRVTDLFLQGGGGQGPNGFLELPAGPLTWDDVRLSGNGVHINAQCIVERVQAYGFGGDGFHVYGSSGISLTNANTWEAISCASSFNGRHGLYIDGPDSNAGGTVRFNATNNPGYGIYDSSFLGNTHLYPHLDANVSGPYFVQDSTSYTQIIGAYVEPGSPAGSAEQNALVIGGHQGSGITNDTNALVGRVWNGYLQFNVRERSDQPTSGNNDRLYIGDRNVFSYDPEDASEVPLELKYVSATDKYRLLCGAVEALAFTGYAHASGHGKVIAENGVLTSAYNVLFQAIYSQASLPGSTAAHGGASGSILANFSDGANWSVAAWSSIENGNFHPIYRDRRVTFTAGATTNNKVVTESTTSRTLADTDDNVTILCTNVGAITITVPNTLSKGVIVRLVQAAAGQITVVGSGGVAIRVPTGRTATSRALYSCIEVEMLGAVDAEVRGDLTGIGDVLGPASSTDNAIVRYDSTTGKLVQNSGVLVDDSANLVLPKTSGVGVKVDVASPTFAWADIIGNLDPKTSGAGTPTLNAFRGGNVNVFSFAANDLADMQFHIPHDYLPGSDIYIHVHWAHNGTAISGSFVCDFFHTYQKGHNQGDFPAEKTLTLTVSTPDIATVPQYRHRVDEVQLSAASPSAAQIDSDDLEPDGVILMRMRTTTIPTITGSTARNEPYIFFVDIHYQTTGVIGTKAKSPGFWT